PPGCRLHRGLKIDVPFDQVERLAVADPAGADCGAIKSASEQPPDLVLDPAAVEHPGDAVLDPADMNGPGDVEADHDRRAGRRRFPRAEQRAALRVKDLERADHAPRVALIDL